MTEYIVPYQDAESEFTEKRSRFITHLYKVETEAEARARIEEMKKKYYDARHNCWCYLLRDGTERYSDDGEPQGTAGIPMLEVFRRAGVTNVVCVVTRYFGGPAYAERVPAAGGLECVLRCDPVLRRRTAGSRGADQSLHQGSR